MPRRITAPAPDTILRTVKLLWQSVSMAAFLGSLITSFIFHGDLPKDTAFVWTMGVFAGSLILVLPLLVLLSIPYLAGIKALAHRYNRYLFPATVVGGVGGVLSVVILLLLFIPAASGMKISVNPTDLISYGGKLLLVGYGYGMSLALFIGLHERPAEHR
jgi:hypothetical protein